MAALLLGVVAALLVLAAPAAAESRTGQGTSPVDMAIPGEADILSATASYDSSAGTVTFTVTTREPPLGNPELFTAAFLGTGPTLSLPIMGFFGGYTEPEAEWFEEGGAQPASEGLVPQTVVGDTKTVTVTSSALANMPYDMALIEVVAEGEETELDEVAFPLTGTQTPPPSNPNPPSNPTPAPPAPAPVTAPPPAALAIGKVPPMKAKREKWTEVKVKVSNSGGTATGPVQLKVKAPAAVKLKPGSGRVSAPAVQPGKSETVSFKVKLTEKAKAKSTLSLTATAGTLSAKGSVVLKAAG